MIGGKRVTCYESNSPLNIPFGLASRKIEVPGETKNTVPFGASHLVIKDQVLWLIVYFLLALHIQLEQVFRLIGALNRSE